MKMLTISRILTAIAGILLTISIFVPIWRIELDAPQYPEGLKLLIFANKLGGNVDIINGLNHYIGMKTLHAEDFIEFTILQYLIGFFALSSFFVALVGNKKLLNVLLITFILFGIIAMADFWRWEYNYGHDLDPNAAIIVPGMAYQPPLIGFKQLLNFGAFSIPDIGGWLFIVSGLLILFAAFWEKRTNKIKLLNSVLFLCGISFFTSCSNSTPDSIKLNKDKCDYCKMNISDGKFGTALLTSKGRTYKFDDLSCMVSYQKAQNQAIKSTFFVNDYLQENHLISAESAFFIRSNQIKSPMLGNFAAFQSKEKAKEMAKTISAELLTWSDVNK